MQQQLTDAEVAEIAKRSMELLSWSQQKSDTDALLVDRRALLAQLADAEGLLEIEREACRIARDKSIYQQKAHKSERAARLAAEEAHKDQMSRQVAEFKRLVEERKAANDARIVAEGRAVAWREFAWEFAECATECDRVINDERCKCGHTQKWAALVASDNGAGAALRAGREGATGGTNG